MTEDGATSESQIMEIAALALSAGSYGVEPEDLDGAVHEACSQLAACTNNEGLIAQLWFLWEQLGFEEV